MSWYVRVDFDSEEDARAFAELTRGLPNGAVHVRRAKHYAVTRSRLGSLILKHMKPHHDYVISDFYPIVEEAGYCRASVAAYLSDLTKEGSIHRIGHGVYRISL